MVSPSLLTHDVNISVHVVRTSSVEQRHKHTTLINRDNKNLFASRSPFLSLLCNGGGDVSVVNLHRLLAFQALIV